jgi:hypothetical protein
MTDAIKDTRTYFVIYILVEGQCHSEIFREFF